jgi:hypothetical protein
MRRNETSPIRRRKHRHRAQMDELLSAIQDILNLEESAITIRHLFYRLVGQNVIEKTELAYKSLCSHPVV